MTADNRGTGNQEKKGDVTADRTKEAAGGSTVPRKGDLADGVTGLVVVPLLKKSISEFAIILSFRGLAVIAKIVLILLGKQLSNIVLVKFLKDLEGVKVGFVKKEHIVVAVAKGV